MIEELFENPPNVRPVTMADGTVVRQLFERGEMLWFASDRTIFVIRDSAAGVLWTWWRGADTWDGVSKPDAEAPEGLLVPTGGFGKVWWEQGFGNALGYAVGGEVVTEGYYKAWGDGWELHFDDLVIELPGDKQWVKPEPGPEPAPIPEPGPTSGVGWWIWLEELNMPINLEYAAWVDANSLRVGQYDAVLVLPEGTAMALRAYIKTKCVEII